MIDKIVARAAELTGAYGNFRTAPERVDAETIALARCTMINQELDLFVRFCYRQSEQGRYVNLRSNSQLPKGVWAPWGSSGKSGLTRTERDVLRRYLFSLNTPRPPRPLFFYGQRHWHVNTVIYPTVGDALQWLERFKLTPANWFDCSLLDD
jgi:hypothetical protein